MANLNQILNSVFNVANTVAPLLGLQVAGAAAAAAAIEKLISDARAAAGGSGDPATMAELERLRQEIEHCAWT